MDIQINRKSDVPITIQISEQVVMAIATGRLKPGAELPSVRQVARRLNVSLNTVSAAYQGLVKRLYVERHRGRKLVVRRLDVLPASVREDLDDLIDAAIRAAREHGYTLQELRKRVRERLMEEPPDHILIVEPEDGLRRLLHKEISEMLRIPLDSISQDELAQNRGAAIGALVVTLPGRSSQVLSLLPKRHPFFVLKTSSINETVNLIHELKRPSVIGVASISQTVLGMAHGVLAPFVGDFHALEEHHLEDNSRRDLSGLDLVVCDAIARRRIKARRVSEYRLVSREAAAELAGLISSAED